jgi:phosphate transport system substrate-binding protein
LQGQKMNGVEPTYATIASLDYPGAREMFIYVKKAHLDAIPGLKEFLAAWTTAWVKDGPLTKIGLIASPDDKMAKATAAATSHTTMTADELK